MWNLKSLVLKNLVRSKTRFTVTVAGCAIAAFVVCLFLAAENSIGTVFSQAEYSNHLLIFEKDKH
jgi:hypothetical protein